MRAVADSRVSRRGSFDHCCLVKETHVDASFCDHVCSSRDACTVSRVTTTALPERDWVIPLTSTDLSQLTQLGVNPLHQKGENLNRIQDRYLQDPQRTKQQIEVLRKIPWINHQTGSEWPTCDCLACCGTLIISVIENASFLT